MKKKAIVIITTILLSIPIFMDTPFAEAHGPNNLIPSPYGTCTYEFYYEANNAHNITIGGITIPQLGPVHVIKYTFTHPYTGTFDIDLNNSSILNNIWDLLTSNCYLMSVVDADTLRFAVNNAEYCEIAIMPSQYYNALFISLKNQNLTPVDDTTTAVNNILTHVNYMDGQIQSIHTDTTMIRNLLISMSGYTADSNDNIATDFDTLLSAMNTVGYDISFSNTYEFSRDFYNLLMANSQKTGNYRYTHDLTYSTPYFEIDPTKNVGVMNNYGSIYQPGRTTYQMIFLTDKSIVGYQLYATRSNGYSTSWSTEYVGNFILNYITIVNGSGWNRFYLEIPNQMRFIPLWYGNINYYPYELTNITHKDMADRYTRKLDAIVDAIGNMAVNVNNLTVNATGITYNVNNAQVNNSVNTYNTDITNVYNVENDFSNSFNTYNQQFTPDFTETMTTIQSVPSVMNDIVVNLYGLPFIKYPLLLTLAGIVLIALLGV